MVQRTPARVQAEQFGYRKSHFFLRLRQKSHAVDTRLLRALGVDVGSGVGAESDVGGGCCCSSDEGEEAEWYDERGDGLGKEVAVGDERLGDSRRNLPSWSRKSLLPELLVIVRREQAQGGWGRNPSPARVASSASDTRASHWDEPQGAAGLERSDSGV
jgi:hypothetical protein